MNKPAAKEPSMDEILSSIRQIIADEDQEPTKSSAPETTAEEALMAQDEDDEPLALSPEQMVEEPEPDLSAPEQSPEADSSLLRELNAFETGDEDAASEPAGLDAAEPETDPEQAVIPESTESSLAAGLAETEEEEPGIVIADDIAFDEDAAASTVADEPEPQAAPLPDANLSADMAEKLLEPTTAAATKHAFARLNQLSMGSGDMTIENMVREMLRPMLKEWLDENLPGVVEKLVEREIERISRGS